MPASMPNATRASLAARRFAESRSVFKIRLPRGGFHVPTDSVIRAQGNGLGIWITPSTVRCGRAGMRPTLASPVDDSGQGLAKRRESQYSIDVIRISGFK